MRILADGARLVCSQTLQEREPERLKIVEADPYTWEAYSTITKLGYLDDVPKIPWDQGTICESIWSVFELRLIWLASPPQSILAFSWLCNFPTRVMESRFSCSLSPARRRECGSTSLVDFPLELWVPARTGV